MPSVMSNLHQKTRIIVEDEDQYLHEDPRTIWNSSADKRLDYFFGMGNRLGLDAALSDRRLDMEYAFHLDVKPHLSFKGKYAQLGSDQAESLIRIGSRNGEDIFLYMCPKTVLTDPTLVLPPIGHCTGPTTLRTHHARIIMTYIAYTLSLMRDERSVYCNDPYEINMPPDAMSWQFTNL